jgi:DNA polymerase elongation subunit (family B)
MSKPRIAMFDIETAPSLGYFWGKLWETDIIEVYQPWYMLCFSWKWYGKDKIHTCALPDYKTFKKDKMDDRELIAAIWKVFDEADILVAHNGDRFDIRKTYARFAQLGMPPPSPAKQIDTYKEAKRWFDFESNRLNTIARLLGVGTKIATTGFALWKRIMTSNDTKAWGLMRRYNRQDVTLLEGVYKKLLPFMRNHPNLTVYDNRPACPKCLSIHIQKRGYHFSQRRKYQRYLCQACHGWFQGEMIKCR